MGQPSWNISSQGIKSVAYTLSTAMLDAVEGLEANLVSEAAVTKDGTEEPIPEDIPLMVSMLQIRVTILQHKSDRP